MTKFLLFGDLHLKANDSLGSVVNGYNDRLIEKLDTIVRIGELAKEHGCTGVVELGDTFDRVNPPDYVRNLYAKAVSTVRARGLWYWRVLGNHETTGGKFGGAGVDTDILSGVGNEYRVFSEPTLVDLPDVTLLVIPEVPADQITQVLTKFPRVPVFGHFGVEGATFPNGIKEKDGISRDLFTNREAYLGHIHARQTLGTVNYIGCVARADFGDQNCVTGCQIVSFEAKAQKATEYVQLKDTFLVDIGYDKDSENVDQFTGLTPSAGCILRITFRGPRHWYLGVDTKAYRKHFLETVQCRKVFIRYTPEQLDDVLPQEGATSSVETILQEKAKADGMDANIGLAFLKEAMNK